MKRVKILKTLATIWLIIFAIVFTIGMISIAMKDGIGKTFDIMSPFNIAGTIVNLISVSPALFLFWWAGKIEKNLKGDNK